MQAPKKVLDRVALVRAASDGFHRMQSTINLARKYETDPDWDQRRCAALCQVHFYAGLGMGGAAMTKFTCSICDKEQWSGSTNVDVLCSECAHMHTLCRHCGADLDLRDRRRKYAFLPEIESSAELRESVLLPRVTLLPKRDGQ
jgi:hypothetical protein